MLAWRDRRYVDHLLSVVGGMASFAYLKFKRAKPPNMVFWGANTKYFVQNLEILIGFKQVILEGRSSTNTLSRLKEFINQGSPVVAGALDMYYLQYYPKIYGSQHIPIHYLLVVGYDDEKRVFYVHDCGRSNVETVSYEDLQKALDVKVPGMSKKNTLRVFEIPSYIPSELEVATTGFRFKANQMLHPPVSMFGIPAMRKLSKEILDWSDKASFDHMAMFATCPPHGSQELRE
ncbi:MAG: BtrH N-terminal domain-containing protein [Thaumarchaeota archaeon]|nr:BtrH N-terminal domain-containing protein [Nitrososphaerota archaeon]MCL5319006.1 BtrH N-terminal domain-containing protein [Nitrososphaerota archaeon]